MKVTIELSKRDMKHLSSPHNFDDECETSCRALYKLQKKIDKINKK